MRDAQIRLLQTDRRAAGKDQVGIDQRIKKGKIFLPGQPRPFLGCFPGVLVRIKSRRRLALIDGPGRITDDIDVPLMSQR
jgi:hypothetical protein